jgi:hypothetical protein
MTTNDIELATVGDDDSGHHDRGHHDRGHHDRGDERPQQTFSWSQANQAHLTTHKIFMLVSQLWIAVVDYHRRAGTARGQWEPTQGAGHLLGAHYNHEAAEQVEKACAEELDPVIEKVEDMGTEIETTVRSVTDRDPKLTSSETGLVYTEPEAVTQVERNQAKINADLERGHTHHKRVPAWVRVLGKIMPYGEALGLVVLLTFFLNVEWTRPWADPLTWTLSVVVVLATLLFTPRMVERAAEGWNKRREAIAENQAEATQAATRKLLINGAIATVVSMAVVGGLVERALAVIDNSLPESMLALIIALCIIAGLAMPAVAFIAIAWDGSSLSRENDDLVEQLNDGLAEDQELRDQARSLDEACGQQQLRVNTEVAPAIQRIAIEVVEEARRAYAWLRVQIGGLPSAPPARPQQNLAGGQATSIETGIPGAEPIGLEPLVNRGLRMQELARKRSQLITKLDATPPHPWSGNQGAA